MKKIEKQKIKEKLMQEIKITNEKILKYSDLSKPIPPENSIGRVSRMDAINNKSVVEAALRTAEKKMQQLIEMKSKIDSSDFGYCKKCNRDISYMRLLIMPYTKYCVRCA